MRIDMSNKTDASEINKLSDCKKSHVVKVLKLNAPSELKQRLISFGIMKESIIEVLKYSTSKNTMEIKVGKTRIALRAQEAALIEVVKL
ncbi:MAG: ferrous iron transport protein A [Sulfurimonas sp.]|nr:ferrous iron transport protein A [Sulfurimonas sp.]